MKEKKKYLVYLQKEGLGESTIQTYVRVEKQMEVFCKTSLPGRGQIQNYLKVIQMKYKPATVNLYAAALNRYFSYRHMTHLKIPTKKLCAKRSLENVISIEEYKRLLEYAKKSGRVKYYLILRVIAATGIRISELKYVTVENVRQGYAVVYNKGRCREIYIAESIKQALFSYCQMAKIEKGPVFYGNQKQPISRNAVWKMLKKMAEQAGIPKEKVYPHSLRHMMAIRYMQNYGNIAELADILGHSSIEITRIYTLTTREEKRKRLEDMGF